MGLRDYASQSRPKGFTGLRGYASQSRPKGVAGLRGYASQFASKRGHGVTPSTWSLPPREKGSRGSRPPPLLQSSALNPCLHLKIWKTMAKMGGEMSTWPQEGPGVSGGGVGAGHSRVTVGRGGRAAAAQGTPNSYLHSYRTPLSCLSRHPPSLQRGRR